MAEITKHDVEKLAELARLRISSEERKEKFVHDFKNILGYFEELKEVDTEGVTYDVGGGSNVDVFREDEREDLFIEERVRDAFPRSEEELLKVPPVFEE